MSVTFCGPSLRALGKMKSRVVLLYKMVLRHAQITISLMLYTAYSKILRFWPARFPDLCPCKFISGNLKEKGHQNNPHTLNELRHSICETITSVEVSRLKLASIKISRHLQFDFEQKRDILIIYYAGKSVEDCYLLHTGFLSDLFFGPEDGVDMFLRNVGSFSMDYTTSHFRR
jgi:hypothetical protein